jgi:hypothetical protein
MKGCLGDVVLAGTSLTNWTYYGETSNAKTNQLRYFQTLLHVIIWGLIG